MEKPLSHRSSSTWRAVPRNIPADVVSRHTKRQRQKTSAATRTFDFGFLLFAVLTLILLSTPCTSATVIPRATGILSEQGVLLFDSSEPPTPRIRGAYREERKQISASTATDKKDATSTSTTGQTTLGSLPKPFDTTLGNNFTQSSCPAFFESFLTNATFTACLPFSLLLQVGRQSPSYMMDNRS